MYHVVLLFLFICQIKSCNVDLTNKGLPACAQACPEWCWATVISEIKEFYTIKDLQLPPASAKCQAQECKIVSDIRKSSCCNNKTECAPGSARTMGCGNPSSSEEILSGFQLEIPKQKWRHMHGRPGYSCKPGDGCYPTEQVLQDLLMQNVPIGRATHGHITVVAGCRIQKDTGLIEYRVLNSLKDPNIPIWMNYTLLTIGPPIGQGDGPWQNTYYSNSSTTTTTTTTTTSKMTLAFGGLDIVDCVNKLTKNNTAKCTVIGNASLSTTYTSLDKSGDPTYNTMLYFSSINNLIAFENAPFSYLPKYGGFDALSISHANSTTWNRSHLGPSVDLEGSWRLIDSSGGGGMISSVYLFANETSFESFRDGLPTTKLNADAVWSSWFGSHGTEPPYAINGGPFNGGCFTKVPNGSMAVAGRNCSK